MNYAEGVRRLHDYRQRLAELRDEMHEVQAALEPQEVDDYAFSTPAGKVRLSELFGHKRDLIVIHNMGRSCPYCTLWADGYNGVYEHLADRAAFVVSGPDAPAEQRRFAESRGWRFPMVSHAGTTFAEDMGYRSEHGWLPGISVFGKTGRGVVRVSDTGCEPGDDFCAAWHLFDLIPGGAGEWSPRFQYPAARSNPDQGDR